MDDFKEFKVSVEEVTADVGEIVREIKLDVEPEDLNFCNLKKKLTDEELLLMDELKKQLPEMDSTSEEDAVKIVEMTRKDLEYNINS